MRVCHRNVVFQTSFCMYMVRVIEEASLTNHMCAEWYAENTAHILYTFRCVCVIEDLMSRHHSVHLESVPYNELFLYITYICSLYITYICSVYITYICSLYITYINVKSRFAFPANHNKTYWIILLKHTEQS